MKPKVRKLLFWVGGGLLALLLVLWLGGWGLLKSPIARAKASQELTKLLGVPVEVDTLDVGTGRTTAAIRIPDPGAGPGENLIRIGDLDTDITLGGLLTGKAAPTHVTAGDVDFLFRIDKQGKILSPFPKTNADPNAPKPAIPDIRIAGGKVGIRQTGKPEFALSGVTGHLGREGEKYVLKGDIDDPAWGKWAVNGHLTADFSDGQVKLESKEAQLSDDRLRSIPYVPKEVWEHVGASGPTEATVVFTFSPNADLGYSVDLKPKKASLTVPDAAVTLTDVQGDIVVANGAVTVKNGTLTLAGGKGTVNGVYDFSKPTAVLKVNAEVSGVDVPKLPAKWGLPKDLEGQLKGKADLELHVTPEGKLDTRGSGNGEVVNAKLKGIPIDEFKLALRGGDGGYRFDGDTR